MTITIDELRTLVIDYVTATLTQPLEQYKAKATALLSALTDVRTQSNGRPAGQHLFTIEHENGAIEHFTGWQELADRLNITVATAQVRMSQNSNSWQRIVQSKETGNPAAYRVVRGHIGSASPAASLPELTNPPRGARKQEYDERLGTEFVAPVPGRRKKAPKPAKRAPLAPGTNKLKAVRNKAAGEEEYLPFTGQRGDEYYIADVRRTKSQYEEETGITLA